MNILVHEWICIKETKAHVAVGEIRNLNLNRYQAAVNPKHDKKQCIKALGFLLSLTSLS